MIYAGNVWEWTTEIVKEKGGKKTEIGNGVTRSIGYADNGNEFTVSSRLAITLKTHTSPAKGFRFVLYIK